MRSQNTNDRLSLGFVGGGVNSAVGYTISWLLEWMAFLKLMRDSLAEMLK